jgi:hypothetical protein
MARSSVSSSQSSSSESDMRKTQRGSKKSKTNIKFTKAKAVEKIERLKDKIKEISEEKVELDRILEEREFHITSIQNNLLAKCNEYEEIFKKFNELSSRNADLIKNSDFFNNDFIKKLAISIVNQFGTEEDLSIIRY